MMVLRLLGYLFIVSGFLGIYQLQNKIAPINFKIEKQKTFYLPTTEACKIISLGFYEMYADILWIRATQFYSEKLFDPARRFDQEGREFWYERMARAFDIITDLDPHYYDVYHYGKSLLFAVKADNDTPLKILKKGYEHNKQDWHYAYELGVGYIIELKGIYQRYAKLQEQDRFFAGDPRASENWKQKIEEATNQGSKWFKIALEYKDLDKGLREIIPRFFVLEGDKLEEILAVWSYQLEESERSNKKQISDYIQSQIFELIHLREFRKLVDGCSKYKSAHKVYPESLEQIRAFVAPDFLWDHLYKVQHKEYVFYNFSYSKTIKGRKKEFLVEFQDVFYFDLKKKKLFSELLFSHLIENMKQEMQHFVDEYVQQYQKQISPEELEQKCIESNWFHPIPWKKFDLDAKAQVIEVWR